MSTIVYLYIVIFFGLSFCYFFLYHLFVNTAVCADPGKPTNGKRLDDNFQNGKTVIFKCNANYDLLGNHSIRCNGGVWSSDAPKCKGNNE